MIALLPHFLKFDPITGDALTGLESFYLFLAYALPFLAVGAVAVTTWLYAQHLGRSRVVTKPAAVVPFPSRSTDEAA